MTQALLTTALTPLHLENGAKMVPFAGYSMPVQYPDGVIKEHLHTRNKAGLFDVSHMGQAWITGAQGAQELEKLIPIDIVGLADGEQRYGFFTNAMGGIEDDLMVSRWGDKWLLVVNADCKEADYDHLRNALDNGVELNPIEERALLALQGPLAHQVMSDLGHDLQAMEFMHCRELNLAGAQCYVSRSGYSGEDGFEISVSNDEAMALAQKLQQHPACQWIGLGARDSLRLEAGLCLYGHDIDSSTTPVEASIAWAIQAVRRPGGDRAGGFIGAEQILAQLPNQVQRKRVAIKPLGRAPVREGALLSDAQGKQIGHVTSGGYSPCLQHPIGMAYVDKPHNKIGTQLQAQVRGKLIEIEVCKTPFVKPNFYRGA